MKNFIFAALAASALVLAGCASSDVMNVGGPAPFAPAVPLATPYECTRTKGNVRVILVKVERATVFTAENVQDAKPGKVYPVATMGITYLVEALGNEPIKNWNVTTDEIAIGNHLVGSEAMPANITPGSSSSIGPTETRPRRLSADRCYVEEAHIRCGSVPPGAATLTLKAGFNDETETFVFENVPLN